MTTSRAVVMVGPRQVELRDIAVPDEAPPGGAILQVLANGICGSDWDLYSGVLTQVRGRPVPFPMVPGHEPIGRIVAIDRAAEAAWNVRAGDRVVVGSTVRCGYCQECVADRGRFCRNGITYSMVALDVASGLWGGMADFMVLQPGSHVVPVPVQLSDDDAVLFNPLANALHWTVERGEVGVGDRVLVLGGGQRGLCCVAAAKGAGAAQILQTGLARDRHKLALAPLFGATATVVVDEDDTVSRVRELTDGAGVDVVVDTVPGATQPIRDAIAVLRPGGTLVVAGLRGPAMDDFPLEPFRAKQLRLLGASTTSPRSIDLAVRTLASGALPFERLHSHSFGLEEAERAIRTLGDQSLDENPIHVVVKP